MVAEVPQKKSDSGLTLIELMIAMVILAFGAVAALGILVEAHKANALAKAKTMAINRAEEQMEVIFQDSPELVEAKYDDTWFAVENLTGNGPAGEAGLITVSDTEPHEVRIEVTWNGSGTLSGGTISISAIRSEARRDM